METAGLSLKVAPPGQMDHPKQIEPDAAAKNILVRGVNWLGDAVMTTPALRRLRERFPTSRITLLTHEKLVSLWAGQPMLDAVVPFRSGDGLWRTARQLRSGGYDVGLALPNSHRSAFELWLAAIPRRIGLAVAGRTWMFTTAVQPRLGFTRMRKRTPGEARLRYLRQGPPEPSPGSEAHQLHDYLHLVAALGADPTPLAPCLDVTQHEQAVVREKHGVDDADVWLGLNPGAAYGPAKRWPVERFIAAAQRLQQRIRCRWMLLGGAEDVELSGTIEAELRREPTDADPHQYPLNLAGRLTLRELCAALACCRAVLTNDTGPMHVAAAVGVPVIVPFGSTSPELTGPGLPGNSRHRILRHPVPCAPCFLRQCPIELQCLNGISTEKVVRSVLEVVESWDGT